MASDHSRGELLAPKSILSDLTLDLKSLLGRPHVLSDYEIVQAGLSKEAPFRTFIMFPGWIYGVGRGEYLLTFVESSRRV